MGLADGDAFVSGSILSYQQALRMMTNFRGASVPSNLQAGALWSDSDDNRLWHQGTTLDEVFTEKTTLTWENLLSNSGFGVWSQSDASKGLATITYDQGAKGAGTAPSVGDAVVGGTSGATAKVISYTIATGTWDAGNATGVVTVGAVSHDFAFVDNETITFGGVETAVINMPDSAVQVGLVQNGGFAAATTGWTAVECTLASIAGGEVGNCLEITRTGAAAQHALQTITGLTIGKIYKLTVFVKSGTSGNESGRIEIEGGIIIGFTSSAAWVAYSITFEATATSLWFVIQKRTATAGTMLFDEVTCYEITPCCTAADALAFDNWDKDTTLDIYREHNGSNTKDGSFYALKLVPHTAADFMKFPGTYFVSSIAAEHYQKYQQRTVTFGAWVKTSKAAHVRFGIYDGAYDYSGYHTGGGDWEWLEASGLIGASATDLQVRIICAQTGEVGGDTIVYISQPMLVFGSHVGEGNYQPKPQEWISLEALIESNLLNNWTDLGAAGPIDLNIEADTDAKLPKGCKAITIYSRIKDSGSLGGNAYMRLSKTETADYEYVIECTGLTNDAMHRFFGSQNCGPEGDIVYKLFATGADTLDLIDFEYKGVQIN